MKKQLFKIFTFLFITLTAIKVQAQELKFPESFRSDTSLFSGLHIAEIPEKFKTKFKLATNPGVSYQPLQLKGLFRSADFNMVEAIYFEVWRKGSMDVGFEVAKFPDTTSLKENALVKRKRRDEAYLSVANYLIIIHADGYPGQDEWVDKLINHFQQKYGAKLILDRIKETAVTEKYATNLPPPLPPAPEENYTRIAIEDLDKRIANADGLAYMRTKNRQKLAPGKYRASSMAPAFESVVFTLDKDSLLHGDYEYHYAEDYSKSPSKESKSTYDHGVLTSEIVYEKGKLIGSTTFTASVVKEGNDYLITIKTITKDPNNGDKDVITLFRNRKPISKITTRAGVSVIKKDFEKKVLEHYNSKSQITKFQKPGLREEYDGNGKTTYKDEWINDDHFIYKNGKLVLKEIGVKGAQQYNVTAYDENGKITNQYTRGIEAYPAIANPDEQEWDLTEALFEYYRKKAK
jgi:antitoxin component YwqK of YwqJK toxin-antitoxin module